MTWERRGLVFRPDPSVWWMRTHAALPTALHLEGDVFRVFFASRDNDDRSHVGAFDISLADPTQTILVTPEPILAPGSLGQFDDHGVYAASIVRDGSRLLMYTIGRNQGSRPPLFYASIGLATSEDGRTFTKHSRAPLLSRSDHDPCFVSAPHVLRESGRWRMWYLSGVGWDVIEGTLRSTYHVKYAESPDGLTWRREGIIALGNEYGERSIARACVVPVEGGYEAWFSADAGEGYRVRFATSGDGISWHRDEGRTFVDPSGSGFESDAVAYPFIVHHGGQRYAFYNGNGFGRDGVALAVETA